MAETILIVDDAPNIVMPLEFLLEKNGYDVWTANSGEEALETILSKRPSLVLLDVMLPGMDGYEVCEIIRLNPECRDIKVVFMTARGQGADISKGYLLGADAYITKPFSNADLIANVKSLLNGNG